ncbi:hypothetical protein ACFJIV_09380 [Mucilaginibacter sp. UC70_90]
MRKPQQQRGRRANADDDELLARMDWRDCRANKLVAVGNRLDTAGSVVKPDNVVIRPLC